MTEHPSKWAMEETRRLEELICAHVRGAAYALERGEYCAVCVSAALDAAREMGRAEATPTCPHCGGPMVMLCVCTCHPELAATEEKP